MAKNTVTEELNEEEKNAVNEAADKITDDFTSGGVWTCVLKKPVQYQGEEIKELEFDFNSLTGADALNIEDELRDSNVILYVSEIASAEYLIRVAARACRRNIGGADFFKRMSIVDFNRIKIKTRLFLAGVAV